MLRPFFQIKSDQKRKLFENENKKVDETFHVKVPNISHINY